MSSLDDDEGPILAVNIASAGGLSRRTGPPRMPSLPETVMRSMLMGSAATIATARRQAAVVVTPDTRGIGLLESIRSIAQSKQVASQVAQPSTLSPGHR